MEEAQHGESGDSGSMCLRDVKRILEAMFTSMLSAEELRSLTFRVVRVADGIGVPDDYSGPDHVWVRWRVLGEEGGSGSFLLEDGGDAIVRFVRGDLQDFIAESGFGWGELRIPRDSR